MEIEKEKRRVIRRMKEIKDEQQLSISKIMEMLDAKGQYVSEPTLKRLFADGSEDKSFRYHDTIMPVADVLLDLYGDKSGIEDVESLREIIREKNKFIESLLVKLEEQKAIYSGRESLYSDRKDIYEKQIKHLEAQISRYEQAIDKKDALIEKLLNAYVLEKECKK